ncbi:MAG: amino acid adenylation domain-containing protein [Luteolibacter sp.]|uniref:non-ribosomal peptide synthetase n=1 Tax=Luteolibacter sp. TaxID=1962973 RepID=UPI0032679391
MASIADRILIPDALRAGADPANLTDAEQHALQVGWNRTETDYPRDKCIHGIFEEQAALAPDDVALVTGDRRMTYRELNQQADHIAENLRGLGVTPGSLVGISVERSFDRIAGLLGILKAGAVYWAPEENLPEDRMRDLVADARPRCVIANHNSAELFSALAHVALVETLSAPPSGPPNLPISPTQAELPAYVSYTSGSTGRPKGVIVPHRGVVRLVTGANYVSLNSGETLLHHSPLSFDASTFEIWGALLNGGTLAIMPPGQPSLHEISSAIHQHGVTTLWLTAGLFHLMVDEQIDGLKPLRQLLAGGDVLRPKHVAKALRELPGCRIINGYGPTENTTFTCCHTIRDENELTPSVPIGRPVSNTRVYILDENLKPLPLGSAGELYAGGDGVACGYLNQPDLTAERFIADPFTPGSRLYRTGDLARWRPDGTIEFLGRIDTQVKIRGFRVELGEIETALRGIPAIREAVVVKRDDMPDHLSLVGYVTLEAGADLSTSELRDSMRELLPKYMAPSAFVVLDRFQLLPNGKLDRRNLPPPATELTSASEPIEPPKDLLELELVRIWQRLFQRESIRVDDDFFDLGGHSLQAAQLVAEIGKRFGSKLPIAALFQSPTIRDLALRLTEDKWLPAWSSLVPLQPLGSKPPLFLVHGWGGDVYGFVGLAHLLAPDQPVYGIQAVGLDGKSARHVSVEEMATHYVREIRSFQPEGPYFLGGYSLGGLIAFEVARQLDLIGQKVALLAMADSDPIGSFPSPIYSAYLRGRLVHHLKHWWTMPNRQRLGYCRNRLRTLREWFVQNHAEPVVVTPPPVNEGNAPQIPGFQDYYHALTSAYKVRPYSGSAHIILSEDGDCHGGSSWRHVVSGGLSYQKIPGTHYQILLPEFVGETAEAFRTAIKQARG